MLFDHTGSGWVYLLDGWANASAAGTGTLHRAATLVFLPGVALRACWTWSCARKAACPAPPWTCWWTAPPAARWHPDGPAWVTRPVCLPPATGVVRVTLSPATSAPLPLAVRSLLLRAARPGEC